MMTVSDRAAFAEELDSFLRKQFDYRGHLTYLNNNHTLDVDRKKVRLYLRLWITPPADVLWWPERTLVIAKIGFGKARVGHGRALLEFLVQQAPRFGYDKIGVESTHKGENIQGFLRKYGFEAHMMGNRSQHWIVPVAEVATRLASTANNATS